MFIINKIVEEDHRMLLANELESITLPNGTTQALAPAVRDAFAIFEDLCLLGNGEHPQFLQPEYLHKTFALELIESVLTNYHQLFRKVSPPLYPSVLRPYFIFVSRVNLSLDMCTTGPLFRLLPDSSRT